MNSQAGFISRILSIAMLGLIFVAGLFYARHAHEGQVLYPLRILGEEIEYALIPSEEGKINFRIDQLNDDSFDIRRYEQKADYNKVAEESKKLIEKSQEIKNRIDDLVKRGQDTKELNENLNSVAGGQICTLATAAAATENKETKEQLQKNLEQTQSLAQ